MNFDIYQAIRWGTVSFALSVASLGCASPVEQSSPAPSPTVPAPAVADAGDGACSLPVDTAEDSCVTTHWYTETTRVLCRVTTQCFDRPQDDCPDGADCRAPVTGYAFEIPVRSE